MGRLEGDGVIVMRAWFSPTKGNGSQLRKLRDSNRSVFRRKSKVYGEDLKNFDRFPKVHNYR
jgi:hypothetical protein